MGFEVEVKYRVADPDALLARLAARGAAEGEAVEQEDAYFAHPARDFAQTDEALRLRRDGASNRVTYKGPKRGGPAKTREEIEVPYADGPGALADMARVLDRLGFRLVARIRKTRRSFALDPGDRPVTIALDRAEGLGTFAEVEALAADESDTGPAQAAVLAVAAELGLVDADRETRSYLRMTLEGAIGPG